MPEGRYSRIEKLKKIGPDNLRKLQSLSVAIIGIGGTGSLVTEMLASNGVGSMTIVDRDYVEESNLHRQIIFKEEDIGKHKVDAAASRISKINRSTKVKTVFGTLDSSNVIEIVSGVDYVLDCTDNITSRLIINDACVKLGKPWVFSSALETYGQFKAIIPGKTSCFACFNDRIPEAFPTCAQVGVLSSVPSIISGFVFSTLVRMLVGEETGDFLYHVEAWPPSVDRILIKRNPQCRSCMKGNFAYLDRKYSGLDFHPLV
ncbi:MAG: HesA/MoeB/ThiF family protein [Thermoplasmata archaeon]